MKHQLDALHKKAEVLERSFDAVSMKNEYLIKETALLNEENTHLKSKNETLRIENISLNKSNTDLQTALKNEKDKYERFSLLTRFKTNQGIARDFLSRRLNLTQESIPNRRILARVFDVAESILKEGEIPYRDLRARYKLSTSTIEHDLRSLRKAGLIKYKRVNFKAVLILTSAGKSLSSEFKKILDGNT